MEIKDSIIIVSIISNDFDESFQNINLQLEHILAVKSRIT